MMRPTEATLTAALMDAAMIGLDAQEARLLTWRFFYIASDALYRAMHGGVYPISSDVALRHSRAAREYRRAGELLDALVGAVY